MTPSDTIAVLPPAGAPALRDPLAEITGAPTASRRMSRAQASVIGIVLLALVLALVTLHPADIRRASLKIPARGASVHAAPQARTEPMPPPVVDQKIRDLTPDDARAINAGMPFSALPQSRRPAPCLCRLGCGPRGRGDLPHQRGLVRGGRRSRRAAGGGAGCPQPPSPPRLSEDRLRRRVRGIAAQHRLPIHLHLRRRARPHPAQGRLDARADGRRAGPRRLRLQAGGHGDALSYRLGHSLLGGDPRQDRQGRDSYLLPLAGMVGHAARFLTPVSAGRDRRSAPDCPQSRDPGRGRAPCWPAPSRRARPPKRRAPPSASRAFLPRSSRGALSAWPDSESDTYLLELPPGAFPGDYAVAAYAICKGKPQCMVAGWNKPAMVPAAVPLRPAQLATTTFLYRRDAGHGGDQMLWELYRGPARQQGRNAARARSRRQSSARTDAIVPLLDR